MITAVFVAAAAADPFLGSTNVMHAYSVSFMRFLVEMDLASFTAVICNCNCLNDGVTRRYTNVNQSSTVESKIRV